jgi:lysozyme
MELIDRLKEEEGLRLKAYRDSLGHWTIGYGHLVQDDLAKMLAENGKAEITLPQAENLLRQDIEAAQRAVANVFPTKHFDQTRHNCLVEMAFVLGYGGLMQFRQFRQAMWDSDWDKAAQSLYHSKWAYQVGDGKGGRQDRVEEIAEMIRTGNANWRQK